MKCEVAHGTFYVFKMKITRAISPLRPTLKSDVPPKDGRDRIKESKRR